MAHIFQLKTKKKINSKIGPGFVFNVPSVWSANSHPSGTEIRTALEAIGGKDAAAFADWDSGKFEILS